MLTKFSRVLLATLLAVLASTSLNAEQRKELNWPREPVRIAPPIQRTAVVLPGPQGAAIEAPLKSLLVGVPLADVGFPSGFRLSNLGGRREVYIPVPQGIELNLADLVLAYDDVSAHDARRSLEILVNDRSVSALALDGKSTARLVRFPLANAVAREGFLKITFLYSGAATQDRCIDVRYVGDSITVRPESMVEFEIGITGTPNITPTAALMPKDVAILLSNVAPTPADIAAALSLSRSISATGRHITFYHGVNTMPALVDPENKRRWTRGLVVVGAYNRIANLLDTAVPITASMKGSVDTNRGMAADANQGIAAARIGGTPILLLTDPSSPQVGRLLENPSLAALRETASASVGPISTPNGPTNRVSFDALGLVPAQAEVFGRADLAVAIATRSLPVGTRPSRLNLDVMVAPDGAGEKAVVSAFVNERFLASSVAAIGEPTRLDFALPDGLVGSVANIRTVVQRRSAQADCRFEPQGYPAEILGSSSVILSAADPAAKDFSDLATLWAKRVEILLPSEISADPLRTIAALANVLSALSKETAPIEVKYLGAGAAPAPAAPFIAVSNIPPVGSDQRVHFDRGRVAITDRAGNALLDIGGLTSGAVAQIVTSNTYPGLWIRSLSLDGSLPAAPAVNLNRGDVALLDKTGVALALSTERDTLLQVSYVDQRSFLTNLDQFRPWIVGGIWVIVTLTVLFVLQRIYRRRHAAAGE
jgi:cellulose synthase operon protein B